MNVPQDLNNPIMTSKGIKKAYGVDELGNDTDELLYTYLQVEFKVDGEKITHSRNYIIEEGVSEEDFIKNHDILNKYN